MRIGFIHPSYPGDDGTGAVYSATRIVRGLSNRGHDVTVFCTTKPGEDSISDLSLRSIDQNNINPHSPVSTNRALKSSIDLFEGFDVIHSYQMLSLDALATIRQEVESSVVLTLNAYGAVCPKNDLMYKEETPCKSRGIQRCLSCITGTNRSYPATTGIKRTVYHLGNLGLIEMGLRNLELIDGFHALSNHVGEIYSSFDFDEEKIRTIPNIVDEAFDVESSTEGIDSFLFVGYLHRHKGADRLVPTFEQYVEKYGPAELTIVGTGPIEHKITDQIEASGVRDYIDFRGRVPNETLPAVYANHDIFLYPARWDEPFGRVFLEALASETPVVATNIGAASEIVGDAGVFVDRPDELVDAMNDVIQNQIKFVSATKTKIDDYREQAVIPQFEALYKNST